MQSDMFIKILINILQTTNYKMKKTNYLAKLIKVQLRKINFFLL